MTARADFAVYKWGVAITVRWSKRVLYVPVPLLKLSGHPLCPVTALVHYLQLTASAPIDGPAFVLPSDKSTGDYVPFTPDNFVSHLRSCLQHLGHPPSHYAAHSFRRVVLLGHFSVD